MSIDTLPEQRSRAATQSHTVIARCSEYECAVEFQGIGLRLPRPLLQLADCNAGRYTECSTGPPSAIARRLTLQRSHHRCGNCITSDDFGMQQRAHAASARLASSHQQRAYTAGAARASAHQQRAYTAGDLQQRRHPRRPPPAVRRPRRRPSMMSSSTHPHLPESALSRVPNSGTTRPRRGARWSELPTPEVICIPTRKRPACDLQHTSPGQCRLSLLDST